MTIEKALKTLGYTQDWLSLGVISDEYLLAQFKKIQSSEDKNAEHYRSWGFYDFLKSKEKLTNSEVIAIFALKDNGPDKCDLHENRIIEIIHCDMLSDEQLELITQFPEVTERPIQQRYLRAKLIRKINRTSVGECFVAVMQCDDPHIHQFILGNGGLKPEHVQWLSQYGHNKKIRNVASQLLTGKAFRGND